VEAAAVGAKQDCDVEGRRYWTSTVWKPRP